jgi:hypothetical protein
MALFFRKILPILIAVATIFALLSPPSEKGYLMISTILMGFIYITYHFANRLCH